MVQKLRALLVLSGTQVGQPTAACNSSQVTPTLLCGF